MTDREFIAQALRPLPLLALQRVKIEFINNPGKILLNGSVSSLAGKY